MWKDGRKILRLVLLLLVVGSTECQPWLRPRHPLCVSQFALANRACAHLPIYTVPPPVPPGPPGPPVPLPPPVPVVPPGPLPPDPVPPGPEGRPGHHHHHNDDDEGHHHHHDENEYHHHHHHNHNHNHSHYRPHFHRHRHHHHRHHDDNDRRQVQEEPAAGTPVEQECCHWIQQVDTDCVCDILVNLPPFLSKPLHEYTLIVDHVCNVTYACPGRIRL